MFCILADATMTILFVCLLGPQLDWDPDIVEGLDDDFNFSDPENILDDDFVVKANSKSETGGDGGGDDENKEEEDQW